jgi:hypothetical protein
MLIIASPLLVTFLNGMAWWTIKNGRPSGRGWAIAASLSLVVSGILIILPMWNTWKYFPVGISVMLLILCGAMMALGIAGLVAFARRDSMAQPVFAAKPPRIAGDGTSRLLDGAALLLVVAGYFWAIHLWRHWGLACGLTMSDGFQPLIQILIAILISIALHEIGHASIGLALGMKLNSFIVGPFQWKIVDGQWKFQFFPTRLFWTGGATALVPKYPQQSKWCEIGMIASGPLANLLTGLIALAAALNANGKPYESAWEFLSILATLNLLGFVRNLIPSQLSAQHVANYSDGALIYQLLRGGPLADYFRAASLAASSTMTAIRSRDYDIVAIQRASQTFTQGSAAVFLRLVASEYFLDRGMSSQASEAFCDAENVGEESAPEIPDQLRHELAFGSAFLLRDAAKARRWWDRIEDKESAELRIDYWLALSALDWIEGRKDEASTAWNRGYLLIQKLPPFGGNEFEQYRYSLLHDCIEKEEAVATC